MTDIRPFHKFQYWRIRRRLPKGVSEAEVSGLSCASIFIKNKLSHFMYNVFKDKPGLSLEHLSK
jgi:hypothetical protein